MSVSALDSATMDAFNAWKILQLRSNEFRKRESRAKAEFVELFGSRTVGRFPDGRVVRRISEQRSGYKVPDGVTIRYVLDG